MALYNRRLSKIAEKRIAAGTYGRKNTGHRWLIRDGLTPCLGARKVVFRGLRAWLKLELKSLFLTPAALASRAEAAEGGCPLRSPAKQMDRSP